MVRLRSSGIQSLFVRLTPAWPSRYADLADFGYPQPDPAGVKYDPNVDIQASSPAPSFVKSLLPKSALGSGQSPTSPNKAQTTVVPWTRGNTKHRRNEVFIDVIETVDALLTAHGDLLQQAITGKIIMKANLSGFPQCRFGLNDRLQFDVDGSQNARARNRSRFVSICKSVAYLSLHVLLCPNSPTDGHRIPVEDVKFHDCVKKGQVQGDGTMTFVPPDGEFELME